MHIKILSCMLFLVAWMLLVVACDKETQPIDLLTAIGEQKVGVVQELMASGLNPNKDPIPQGMELEGAYPLHLAVVMGNKEIVDILLKNGAKIDLEARNKDKATPLHWAAFFGKRDMVKVLIDRGAPLNRLDANQLTPLDSGVISWTINEDAKEKAWLAEILAIIKAKGGKSARDL